MIRAQTPQARERDRLIPRRSGHRRQTRDPRNMLLTVQDLRSLEGHFLVLISRSLLAVILTSASPKKHDLDKFRAP